MAEIITTMGQQVAEAVAAFQQRNTGHSPQQVSVVLSDHTLVVTLHGALTQAETALAKTQEGAVKVQEYHKQLFNESIDSLREEIQKITGVAVREAVAEIATPIGAITHAFPTGTLVQVFLMAEPIPTETWDSNGKHLFDETNDSVPSR